MIKKFLILLLATLVNIGVYAQSKQQPEWNIGVGFGPTFSSMSFVTFYPPNVKTKNSSQYHGGVAVRYISEKNLGIIGEINYSQQGWEGSYKDYPLYKHSHSLTYIEVPILTHIYFGNKVRFFVNLGPKVQFLIDEKEKINEALANSIANNTDGLSILQYNKNADNKFDYGLLAGLGMEFRTGIGHFAIEGRYYFGLGDIYNNKKSAENFSRSANRGMSAKLTYYVKLF